MAGTENHGGRGPTPQERAYDDALSSWEERAPGDWREAGRPPELRADDASGHAAGALDPAGLERLANARMPFGKYEGRLLIDLPEAYVLWFSQKGWPRGETGRLLESLLVIKENGLEPILRPLVKPESGQPPA